ncbi:L-seryl-tRNA(Sec) selenium transferase [Haloplasma contractile]|uniref:L-seryl-tRNA(Sec) selenium transferase n=1 Tax=Haloplasma contractile SSD-17B TaxID=1033810 RepID=U2FQ98_9MOLU|nr:L-seryl-tRNA(Sec) selenium transferase [Haloplasma contractile]ERJ13214.1 L-seryl-tRNA selenium transferase protein [Haloplasma contractile SSD-17B]
MNTLYKQIPQVSKLLNDKQINHYIGEFFQIEVKNEIEKTLNEIRVQIREKAITELSYESVVHKIIHRLEQKNPYSLRKVVNGTGTIVHTNLGRSLLSKQAIDNVVKVCSGYNNLEYNVKQGNRGSRYDHVEGMIANIVGSEAALVVNNNAAATMLSVAAFCEDKEVVVSRGELVEIGGSFRIPDIIEVSRASLKEVGTTNRTHVKDYERATSEQTAMYLKVHPSNYLIQGFTKNVSNDEIVELAANANKCREQKIITMEDLGSGVFIDFSPYDSIKENTVKESVQSGIDIVTFSGDKLLGGPQAGIIVGKREYIDQIKQHPLCRALRVGKMTIAALEGTLRDYYDELVAVQSIPTLNMILKNTETLREFADNLSDKIKALTNRVNCEVVRIDSTVGGGSLPLSKLPSYGVTIRHQHLSTQDIEKIMRQHTTPVIGRINNEQYVIDVRTLCEGDEQIILDALMRQGDFK